MATSNAQIESAALTTIQSYASAMALASSSPPTPLPVIAAELAKHYLPNFTAFSLGYIHSAPDTAAATAMIQGHFERLVNSGVGCDIREAGSRVQIVGQGSALCWITWKIVPAEGWKGGEGWEWENCYFYRRKVDGVEGFEGVIADGEMGGLAKHAPGSFIEF
jgi:hypothetical protein